jgi:hypothetical protein
MLHGKGENMTTVPYGCCHCECGGKTKIPNRTNRKYGWVKGVPRKYIFNHDKRRVPVIEDALPFKIDGVYCRLIPLTKGFHAIVDAADYEWLMQWPWQAHYSPKMKSWYAVRTERGTKKGITMHGLINGTPSGKHTDHENHCTIDNRRKNIRSASASQNAGNRIRKSDNKSGYKGVYWNKFRGMWVVAVCSDGKRHYVGAFPPDQLIEAAKAYDAKARLVFGKFAKLNFPDPTIDCGGMYTDLDDWPNCSVPGCEFKSCTSLQSDKCHSHTNGVEPPTSLAEYLLHGKPEPVIN